MLGIKHVLMKYAITVLVDIFMFCIKKKKAKSFERNCQARGEIKRKIPVIQQAKFDNTDRAGNVLQSMLKHKPKCVAKISRKRVVMQEKVDNVR